MKEGCEIVFEDEEEESLWTGIYVHLIRRGNYPNDACWTADRAVKDRRKRLGGEDLVP